MDIPEPIKKVPPIAWVIGIGIVILLVVFKGKGSGSSGGVVGSAGGGSGGGEFQPDLNAEFTTLAAGVASLKTGQEQLSKDQAAFQKSIAKQITPPSVVSALRAVTGFEGQIISLQQQRAKLAQRQSNYAVAINGLQDRLATAKTTKERTTLRNKIKLYTGEKAQVTSSIAALDKTIATLTKQLTAAQKATVAA